MAVGERGNGVNRVKRGIDCVAELLEDELKRTSNALLVINDKQAWASHGEPQAQVKRAIVHRDCSVFALRVLEASNITNRILPKVPAEPHLGTSVFYNSDSLIGNCHVSLQS